MATIRPATERDHARITEIYNHYVEHGAVTFDTKPFTTAERADWFAAFGDTGPHRLLVVEEDGRVEGYAGSMQHRKKAAYDTTVELTIYLAPESEGRGHGRALYAALLAALEGEPVRTLVAGITLPNPASIALHEHFGFREIGVFHEVGTKHGQAWDVVWYERPLRPGAR